MIRPNTALVVTAHPDPNSFTQALKAVTLEWFAAHGTGAAESDLYRMKFSPAAGFDDFSTGFAEPFDLQDWQLAAYRQDGFSEDVAQEIAKLKTAELLVLHFPLWWFSTPAILKGWIDRVFAYGFAYGRYGNLSGAAPLS